VRLTGTFGERPLASGTYRIDVMAVRGKSRTSLGRISVQVVPPGRHLRSPAGQPPKFRCAAPRSLPAVLLGKSFDPSAPGRDRARHRPPVLKPPDGLSFPRVHLPLGSGTLFSISILALLLYTALVVGGTALLVYGVRFFRGTWSP